MMKLCGHLFLTIAMVFTAAVTREELAPAEVIAEGADDSAAESDFEAVLARFRSGTITLPDGQKMNWHHRTGIGPSLVADPGSGQIDDGVDAIERSRVDLALVGLPADLVGSRARWCSDDGNRAMTGFGQR